MSRPLAPSTSNSSAPLGQRIVNFVADRVGISGPASNDNNNKMPAAKSKIIAPAGTAGAPGASNEDFVRTRDALITAITGLSSSLDKFSKAYLEHSEAVLESGGVLDIGPAIAPLAKLIPGAAPGAFVAAPTLTAVNGADALVSDELELLDADGKKKKRKRNTKPRDPNAPKRPMTAYFRFMKEMRPQLTEQLKNEPIAEDGTKLDINKLATERWKGLTDQEREQYAAAYRKDRQGYEAEMKALGKPVGKADMHGDPGVDEHGMDLHAASLGDGITYSIPGVEDIPFEEEDAEEEEDEDEDEETVPVAPTLSKPRTKSVPVVAAAPESTKKTPRQTKKKSAAAAKDPEAPTPQFSSINAGKGAAAAAAISSDATSSPAVRKRKAAKTETDSAPKKRGRKSNADKVAEAEADAAAASAQLEQEQPPAAAAATEAAKDAKDSAKGKKDKKKKRKSEAE